MCCRVRKILGSYMMVKFVCLMRLMHLFGCSDKAREHRVDQAKIGNKLKFNSCLSEKVAR